MLVLEMTPEHGLGEFLQPNGTVVLSSGNATSGAGHGLTLRLHLCPVWLREDTQQREIKSKRLWLVRSCGNQIRCNCCDRDGPSARIEKSPTISCWRSVFSIAFVRGKFGSPTCQGWSIRVLHKVLWARTTAAPYECMSLGTC